MPSTVAPLKRPTLKMLPVDALVPTPDNRRGRISDESVRSLARSIARDGLLQPVIVRPHPQQENRWEIRAGERRWRAARLAGLTEIPAIVRSLDDASAMTVTIAENILRENLHPLEEATAIQDALSKGVPPKLLATRLGKPLRFLLRRASLTRLSGVWQQEVRREHSEAGRLSVAHLELIARLPAETQEMLAENQFHRVFARGFPTVEELRRTIDNGLRTLVSIPWELDDDTLDPKAGSCLDCPKRSGMQPALFENEDAPKGGKVSRTDRCLDCACFDRKHAAFITRRESELRRDHPELRLVQIGFDGIGPAAAQAVGDRTTRLYSPRFVKAGNRAGTPAMQISGPKAGQLVHIEFEDMRASGRVKPAGTAAGGKPAPMSLEERQARLHKRRDAFVVAKVLELLRAMTPESLAGTVAEIGKRTDAVARQFDPLSLVLAFGTSSRADREHDHKAWARYEQLRLHDGALPAPTALHEVVQVWIARLGGPGTHHVTDQAHDARGMCGLLGIDSAAIQEQAEKEIPTPKSWAALKPSDTSQVADTKPAGDREAREEPPFVPSGSGSPRGYRNDRAKRCAARKRPGGARRK